MTNEMPVSASLREKPTISSAGGFGDGAETMKKALIDLRELKRLTAQSRSAIYAKSDPKNPYFDPTFPKRIYVGPKSVRWKLGEILDWIDSRPRASESEAAGAV
ncbi:helix-turn-helix transcriptional regulator [Paraburkholderia tropica]|uniref:helix-turn-helix transcriptional regulator n=1 Tax=Paraburkholderia tropica TaxID=92647 RepID=UPI000A48A5BC|nr:AlpA family phage regulatory protein [Paraburkholderia tropica]